MIEYGGENKESGEVNKEANDAIWKVYENFFLRASRRCITGRRLHSECIPILIKFLSVIYCELI